MPNTSIHLSRCNILQNNKSVSYTHLTLPTIPLLSVDLGGRRIIKKKTKIYKTQND